MNLLGVAALLMSVIAFPASALEKSETLQRSFKLQQPAGGTLVVVDNVTGAIDVVAGGGDTVELELVQTWRGRTEAKLARAKEAVVFEVVEKPGVLELTQGGSWRCHGARDCWAHDYDVEFDWTLRVPPDVNLELRNVNGGSIRVTGVAGHVSAKHVNGAVELTDVTGTVDARTVNGRVVGVFAATTPDELNFATVNGSVDLTFPKDLNADVGFSTVNGDLFTDFPYAVSLPTPAERGLVHLVKGGSTRIRIGAGGLPLRCETVNGNITIHSR